jgi:hypothetical protein
VRSFGGHDSRINDRISGGKEVKRGKYIAGPEFLFEKNRKDRRESSIVQEFLTFRTEVQVNFRGHRGDLSRFSVASSGEQGTWK